MKSYQGEDNSYWISISDLMSGLMIIFLFIAISYMMDVIKEKDKIKEVAVTFQKLRKELYVDLNKEFEEDAQRWGAIIDSTTLSIRFEAPDILFDGGEKEIPREFKLILDDFFPRYFDILYGEKYRGNIEEVRIEGHTSSDYGGMSGDPAYFENMSLSQDRTRSVLAYVLAIEAIKNNEKGKDWLKEKLTANGLSSSKILKGPDGHEDKERSRRVEFKVKTDAQEQILKILTF